MTETTYPADSIEKWNSQRAFITEQNRKVAEKNPYGFTDSARSFEKRPGVYRIAVLGDSFIWGDGIPYHLTWSHLLEKRLTDTYRNAEVMSWGKCGWSTRNQYAFFTEEGYKYHIDLLIVAFVENDPEMVDYRPEGIPENEWILSLYTDSNLKEFHSLLKKIAAWTDLYQLKLLFVTTPICVYPENEERNNKIIALLKKEKIPYLDLYPKYKKRFSGTDCRRLFVNPVNGHPGTILNEFFAEEVIQYLAQNHYLKSLIRK